jgi:ABC-type nitrate/sulfonate/bicarbonate transport system substrate-binding protein
MYWFLIMHKEIGAKRGDIDVVKGRRIGAAPWVEMGLRQLLIESGIDLQRDKVAIAPVPGTGSPTANFGLMAAKALQERKIDGFWANGMGAEVAIRGGWGTLVLDVRRGDGPQGCFNYTMASVAASDLVLERAPGLAAATVRALDRTHAALKADVSLATRIGRKLFPPSEAALIADIVARDLPYYTTGISRAFVAGMQRFARDVGILQSEAPYETIVAPEGRAD